MAGAPKKEETALLRMRVSAKLYDYLGVLKQDTILGASENDVAAFVLTQRLEQMIADDYHVKRGRK
jgi:hypothetical protein